MNNPAPGDPGTSRMTRRDVLLNTAAAAGAVSAGLPAGAAAQPAMPLTSASVEPPPQLLRTHLAVNGRDYMLEADSRTTLLDALREHLLLTGSKKGCDHGQCGACTVLVEGRRINACLTLAAMHDGQSVTTIEGMANGQQLHPLQEAFLKHDGFQCGYCTPGQICSAAGMLAEVKLGMPSHVTASLAAGTARLSGEEIRERMSGNICRCSAYPNIVAAIQEVGERSGMAA